MNRLIANKYKLEKNTKWTVDLPGLSPLILRCPAHFQLGHVSCAAMHLHIRLGYFYSFIRIAGWFDSSIRLTPAHSSFTTAKVPQSSCQNTGSVNGCYCCSHAHTQVPISPRVCLLSNNRALPCRNTLKLLSLSLSHFTSLPIKLSALCVTHPFARECGWDVEELFPSSFKTLALLFNFLCH